MFFIAIAVATIAMLLGVGGALFFTPIFIILFPILGMATLSPGDAVSAALITELFGFSSGLYGYAKRRLIDKKTALSIILFGIPAAILGTLTKRMIPGYLLILILSIGLLAMGVYTLLNNKDPAHDELNVEGSQYRSLIDIDNNKYEYMVCNPFIGKILTFLGGFITGLISIGIGETTVSTLRIKCGLPMKVASGTSVLVVTVVVLTASLTDIILVGMESIPWELLMFTIPGVLIGGQIGPKLASKINPEHGEKMLIVVFFIIGLLMLGVYLF